MLANPLEPAAVGGDSATKQSAPPMPSLADRQPKQSRSRESLEKVIVAAAAILEKVGYEGLTLQEVSRLSGVSIGSIYARVAGKDELVRLVQQRAMARIDAEQARLLAPERWAAYGLSELVPALVDELAEFLRRHAALLRAFMMRASQDEVIGAVGRASALKAATRFQDVLLGRRDQIGRPDPERAIAACYTVIYSTFGRFLGLGIALEAAGGGDWQELKQDVAAMCLCFLEHAPASPPAARSQPLQSTGPAR